MEQVYRVISEESAEPYKPDFMGMVRRAFTQVAEKSGASAMGGVRVSMFSVEMEWNVEQREYDVKVLMSFAGFKEPPSRFGVNGRLALQTLERMLDDRRFVGSWVVDDVGLYAEGTFKIIDMSREARSSRPSRRRVEAICEMAEVYHDTGEVEKAIERSLKQHGYFDGYGVALDWDEDFNRYRAKLRAPGGKQMSLKGLPKEERDRVMIGLSRVMNAALLDVSDHTKYDWYADLHFLLFPREGIFYVQPAVLPKEDEYDVPKYFQPLN